MKRINKFLLHFEMIYMPIILFIGFAILLMSKL